MKFELNPTMVLTKEEHEVLDKALKLCKDMDTATTYNEYDEDEEKPSGCEVCPKRWTCSRPASDCLFTVACKILTEIMNMAVIK